MWITSTCGSSDYETSFSSTTSVGHTRYATLCFTVFMFTVSSLTSSSISVTHAIHIPVLLNGTRITCEGQTVTLHVRIISHTHTTSHSCHELGTVSLVAQYTLHTKQPFHGLLTLSTHALDCCSSHFVCLSVCLSLCLSVSFSVCLSVCLSVSV